MAAKFKAKPQLAELRAKAVGLLRRYVESGSVDKVAYGRYRAVVRAMYEWYTDDMTRETRVEVRWREYEIVTEKVKIEVEAGFRPPLGERWYEWRRPKM
jgi:hypothetical protein